MNNFQDVERDLLELTPENPIEYLPPFSQHMTLSEKFDLAVRSVDRAGRLQDRLLQLVNAFYLGFLLEMEIKPTEREHYARRLSTHYRITAVRLYYLFEISGVKQIMRTKRTTLTTIKRLTSQEFRDLVQRSSEIFQRG